MTSRRRTTVGGDWLRWKCNWRCCNRLANAARSHCRIRWHTARLFLKEDVVPGFGEFVEARRVLANVQVHDLDAVHCGFIVRCSDPIAHRGLAFLPQNLLTLVR